MGLTARFYLTVFITVIGASFQFYSFAVLNTTADTIQRWINVSYVDRDSKYGVGLSSSGLTIFWSFTNSIIAIGGLLGSLCTRSIAEKLGRRNGLLLNGGVNVLAGVIEVLSNLVSSPELLMLGRLLFGINIGLSCGLAPMYLTEIAPVRYRGAVGTTHQILAAFGDWFCMVVSLPQVLGTPYLWPIALTFPAIPAVFLCIILPFCPESPRYLMISRGDTNAAYEAARSLVSSDDEALSLIEGLQEEIDTSFENKETYDRYDWLRKRELYLPALIVIVVMIAQQFTGIGAVLSYSSNIFNNAGLSLGVSQIATAGVGFCYFASTIPAIWLIEYLGRRALSMFQLIGCLTCLILISVFVSLDQDYHYEWASSVTIAVVAVYMCIYGVGSPVPWLISSELFMQEYRSTAVAIGTFTSFSNAFLVTSFYLPLQEATSPALSFIPFIGILFVCILILFILLPETKNRKVDDIVGTFKRKKSAYFSLGGEDLMTKRKQKLLITDDDDRKLLLSDQERRDKRRYWQGYGTAQG